MRTIVLSERSRDKLLHIEAPGCIINIRIGLTNNKGQEVTHVSVTANSDRFQGEPAWWIDGEHGNSSASTRIVKDRKK